MSILKEKADAILLDKETNLITTNLKQGVTCMGVDGGLPAMGIYGKASIIDIVCKSYVTGSQTINIGDTISASISAPERVRIWSLIGEQNLDENYGLKRISNDHLVGCSQYAGSGTDGKINIYFRSTNYYTYSCKQVSTVHGGNTYMNGDGTLIIAVQSNVNYSNYISVIEVDKQNTTASVYDVCPIESNQVKYGVVFGDYICIQFVSDSNNGILHFYKWDFGNHTIIDYGAVVAGQIPFDLGNGKSVLFTDTNNYNKFMWIDSFGGIHIITIDDVNYTCSYSSRNFINGLFSYDEKYIVRATDIGVEFYLFDKDNVTTELAFSKTYDELGITKPSDISNVAYDNNILIIGQYMIDMTDMYNLYLLYDGTTTNVDFSTGATYVKQQKLRTDEVFMNYADASPGQKGRMMEYSYNGHPRYLVTKGGTGRLIGGWLYGIADRSMTQGNTYDVRYIISTLGSKN